MSTANANRANKFTKRHEYIDDLKDLGKHYIFYKQMMDYWKSVLPLPIHDLHYEQLTSNAKQEIPRLLEICHLPFEKSCLAFHETKRAVLTASATQVREKMYTSSVGRWRRYEPYLGDLLAVLHAKDEAAAPIEGNDDPSA